MVAFLQRRHPRPHIHHDAGPFMAENHREQALRVGPGAGEFVGMADAGGLDLHQHLPGPGAFQVHLLDHQGLACGIGDSGFCFHGRKPLRSGTRMCGIWVMVAKC